MRKELRPFYISQIELDIQLPDLPKFEETFLCNVFEDPAPAPMKLSISLNPNRIGEENQFGLEWYDVTELDITTILRIICSPTLTHKMAFVVHTESAGFDWLTPVLGRVKYGDEVPCLAAWQSAFNDVIDSVRLTLSEPESFEIVLKEEPGRSWPSDIISESDSPQAQVYLTRFLHDLGFFDHEEFEAGEDYNDFEDREAIIRSQVLQRDSSTGELRNTWARYEARKVYSFSFNF